MQVRNIHRVTVIALPNLRGNMGGTGLDSPLNKHIKTHNINLQRIRLIKATHNKLP